LPGYLVLGRGFTAKEMGFYSSVPFLAMSATIMLAGLASDWLIRKGWRETVVRKSFIVAGMAIACLIVPAGMVEDKMTSVWLLAVSLCGLGPRITQHLDIDAGRLLQEHRRYCLRHSEFGGNVGGIIAPALTLYRPRHEVSHSGPQHHRCHFRGWHLVLPVSDLKSRRSGSMSKLSGTGPSDLSTAIHSLRDAF
jgi:hypothetical protein